MTDLVRGNPDDLDAYSQATTTADDGVTSDVDGYGSAWTTFTAGTFVPPLALPTSKYDELGNLVGLLRTLDGEPAGLASALRALDENGDGALNEADGVSPVLLDMYVQEHVKDPTASPDVLERRAQLVIDTGVELFTVEDRGFGNTPVITLNMEALGPLERLTDAELQALLQAYGLTGENGGPLHFVVHGLDGTSSGAAENTAQLYDDMGVEDATVVAVNWDGTTGGFRDAEAQSMVTGDALARVFTHIAAANPDANVAVTAHSLGNHVALRALSQMEDPVDPITGETVLFGVDYTGIQPAIPDDAYSTDPETYGALVNGRIEHLSLSINNDDLALLGYEVLPYVERVGEGMGEVDSPGPVEQALGDETADSEEIQEILRLREEAGLDTVLIDHSSDNGDGHLTIDPGDAPYGDPGGAALVESLYTEQIDRMANGEETSPFTEARERVYQVAQQEQDSNPYEISGDRIFESAEVQEYLDGCRLAGSEPDADRVAEIAQEEIERLTELADAPLAYEDYGIG